MEDIYRRAIEIKDRFFFHLTPEFRRIIRFLALPYCFANVNWHECKKAKALVALDFLYIFFRLKYFPDNYSPCRLWEKDRSMWKYYYGSNYDPYQRKRLRIKVQPKEYEIVFRDKQITYQLCIANAIPIPKQLGYVSNSHELSSEIDKLFNNNPTINNLIIKPVDGKGGSGVLYAENTSQGISLYQGSREVSFSQYNVSGNLIIQEFVKQHPELNKISSSVNTARVVTLLNEFEEVIIIGTYMRFGIGKSKIDNLSQGGLCVAASQEYGNLIGYGYDRNAISYKSHPTSSIEFEGFKIPFWNEVIELAKTVQKKFSYYKLIGLDIAITEGGPVVIEVNSNYDNVDLEQACGPILKNPQTLKAFKAYNLLINKQQKLLSQGA